MSSVRAKFKVTEIKRNETSVPDLENPGKYKPGEVRSVVMSPVYGNGNPDHENTKFWQASPSGGIVLGCANLAAAECFELGQEYYVDFTKAAKE